MKNLQVNLYFFARKLAPFNWLDNTFNFFPTVTFKFTFKSKHFAVQSSLTFSYFSDRN